MRKADTPPEQLSLDFDFNQQSNIDSTKKLSNVVQFVRKTEDFHKQTVFEDALKKENEIIKKVLMKARSLGW